MNTQTTYKIFPGAIQQGHSIEVEFQVNTDRYPIFFRSADVPLTANLESSLAAMLLPCMSSGGGTISAQGEVSQRLLSALPTIQDIYCSWIPSYQRAEIDGITPRPKPASTEGRVGAFFSGGVDSFYTFLKHKDEITDLIFLHGLDIQLGNTSLREKNSSNIREVASHFGKNVIEIETNIRELLDPYIRFGIWGHGIALIIAGHLLSPAFRRLFIPATNTYAYLIPKGTHPILDPLWSAEALEFVHDGCEATRVEKVGRIAPYDIALRHLRVCHSNVEGVYNCGRCEKCLRTMISLEAHGALERCTAFDTALDLQRVRGLNPLEEKTEMYIRENLDALSQNKANEGLRKALQTVLNRPLWLRKFLRRVGGYKRKLARTFYR